ncbi:MAG TPA: XRE family transcriptional regulator [Vicinamibacterales bacterium]|nr:XRE family transcriptional regulator [Vicinamibacterales bacterium]
MRRNCPSLHAEMLVADHGFPDAAERQAKLRLAYALNQVLQARKLSQGERGRGVGESEGRSPSEKG